MPITLGRTRGPIRSSRPSCDKSTSATGRTGSFSRDSMMRFSSGTGIGSSDLLDGVGRRRVAMTEHHVHSALPLEDQLAGEKPVRDTSYASR